jgi:hypothetical protein
MNLGKRRRVPVSSAIGIAMTVLATLAIVPPSPAPAAQATRPNLQGSWSFNAHLTAQIASDQSGDGRGEGSEQGVSGRRRRGGGEGGGGPRGSGRPDAGEGSDRDGKATAATTDAEGAGEGGQEQAGGALDLLIIAQDGDQITITDHHGRARVVKADGHKVRNEPAPGRAVEQKASWDKEGALRVEIKPDKGARRTESYLISNDRKHLYLTVTTEGGARPGKETIRAYDRADPQPAAPDASAAPSPPPQS